MKLKKIGTAVLAAAVLSSGMIFGSLMPASAASTYTWGDNPVHSGTWKPNEGDPSTGHTAECDGSNHDAGSCGEKTSGIHNMSETSRTPATCQAPGSFTETCSDCGYEEITQIEQLPHDFKNDEYGSDFSHHWKICANDGCDETGEEAAHMPGDIKDITEATCNTPSVYTYQCSICGQIYAEEGSVGDHDYENSEIYDSDDQQHWKYCNFGCEVPDTNNKEAHSDPNGDGNCDVCGHAMPDPERHVHTEGGWLEKDGLHYKECTDPNCNDRKGDAAFVITSHTENWGGEYGIDIDHHWKVCAHEGCGIKGEEAAHSDTDGDGSCDVCGYTVTPDDPAVTPDDPAVLPMILRKIPPIRRLIRKSMFIPRANGWRRMGFTIKSAPTPIAAKEKVMWHL